MIARFLEYVEPEFRGRIGFAEERLHGFDAVIATGSNNTARHFEYYFGKVPNIIRRNRNSVAVLTGNETPSELELLGEDMFRYFGLGCRSVSKLFVPADYDFDLLFGAIFPYGDLIHYEKYRNNYDYNKAVYLMSQFRLLENGFVMLKEDASYSSPIATIFYEYYPDPETLRNRLEDDRELIQCIVAGDLPGEHVRFGETQMAETPAIDPKVLVGRTVESNASELLGQPDKYYMNLKFKIKEVNDHDALTCFHGYSCAKEHLCRIIRKRSQKVRAIVEVETKDGWRLQMVSLVSPITRAQTAPNSIQTSRS